jgi:hypothetical protein
MPTLEQNRIPFIYGPSYRDFEVKRSGREKSQWQPLVHVLEQSGYRPYIVRPDWDNDPRGSYGWMRQMVDMALEVTKPGDRVVLAGSSVMGLMGAYAVGALEALPASERRDTRFLGCSVSPWFRPFVDDALADPDSDLNTMAPDWLRDTVYNLPYPHIMRSRSQLYVGDSELHTVRRVHEHFRVVWPHVDSFRIHDLAHDTLSPSYLDLVARNAGRLAVLPALSEEEIAQHEMKIAGAAAAELFTMNDGRAAFFRTDEYTYVLAPPRPTL